MQLLVTALLWFFTITSWASNQVVITMYLTKDSNKPVRVGTIIAQDTEFGLLLTPNLQMMQQGTYGFHVHEKPKCGKAGKLAGGHLDPENTSIHAGPYTSLGHLGDLPNIFVNEDGNAIIPVLAPRLRVSDILKRSLIIHSKKDNYDQESFLDSGHRVVCGIVPKKAHKDRLKGDIPKIDVIH